MVFDAKILLRNTCPCLFKLFDSDIDSNENNSMHKKFHKDVFHYYVMQI